MSERITQFRDWESEVVDPEAQATPMQKMLFIQRVLELSEPHPLGDTERERTFGYKIFPTPYFDGTSVWLDVDNLETPPNGVKQARLMVKAPEVIDEDFHREAYYDYSLDFKVGDDGWIKLFAGPDDGECSEHELIIDSESGEVIPPPGGYTTKALIAQVEAKLEMNRVMGISSSLSFSQSRFVEAMRILDLVEYAKGTGEFKKLPVHPVRYGDADNVLPEGFYKGGFTNSAEAVIMAQEVFGIGLPATLYYPGSSKDTSLAGISDIRTIHADKILDQKDIDDFALIGAEAYAADAESWQPPAPVDMVALINPSGMDALKVLENCNLREGGLVLWASWDGPPDELQSSSDLELVGVAIDSDEGLSLDTKLLDEYFKVKQFNELSEDEQASFIEKFNSYLEATGEKTEISIEDIYNLLQQPDYQDVLSAMSYRLQHKKSGTFFIYKKN